VLKYASLYLGSEAFIGQAQKRQPAIQDLSEVPRVHRRAPPKPLTWYAQISRNSHRAMALAYSSGGYTLKEIGEYFAVHYSTVSRVVKRAEGEKLA